MMPRDSIGRVHSIRSSRRTLLAVVVLVGCSRIQDSQPLSSQSKPAQVSHRTIAVQVQTPMQGPELPIENRIENVFSALGPSGDTALVAFVQTDEPETSSSSEEQGDEGRSAQDSKEQNPETQDPAEQVDADGDVTLSTDSVIERDETNVAEDQQNDEELAVPNTTSPERDLPTSDAPKSSTNDASRFEPAQYVQWPKPELLFFVTGRQHGYIEPCGCTGLENAKGGLARRHTLLKDLRKCFGVVTAFDVGNQVRRFGRQAELKFQATVDSLETMEYAGIGLGPDDLKLSTDSLISAVVGADPETTRFVCANVDIGFTPTHRVLKVNKRRIGITSVLGAEHIASINNDEIQIQAPEIGLRKALDALEAEKCELVVLLAHASLDETRELVRQFPKIQIVITAGGAGEPTVEPERIPGCFAYIIQVGTKGMYGGVVGIFMDPKQPVRYERVPLDARFTDSAPMLERFVAYQNDLKEHGFEQLGVKPVRHPFDPDRKYVGHAACADCHDRAAEVFANTPHAHATQSIIEPPNTRSEISRIYDPECVSCHVTGWDAQAYVPYETGYWDVQKSAHLYANGCENCHGPGSRHVAVESGEFDVSDEQAAVYRNEMRITLDEAKTTKCFECHDLDNSPTFQEKGAFEKYWEQIKHYSADE